MPRFFVGAEQVGGGRGAIVGADAAHLARALRVRPGELVRVVDDAGVEHGLRVDAVSRERIEGAVEWSRPVTGEPRLRVHVLQALPQGGIDGAVETLTAVGVASIRPFAAERGVARPDARRGGARRERWRSIAREAAQQALRGTVPDVYEPATLQAALEALPPGCLVLLARVGADQHVATLDLGTAADVAVVIGPEGGLSPGEMSMLEARAARAVHLGPRVLRSRLAGTIAVALLIASAERADVSPAARP
ncbi:MAG TPA: RsmE family RNA methyltransferase [Candidatus Dormibacteraeota bacterium]